MSSAYIIYCIVNNQSYQYYQLIDKFTNVDFECKVYFKSKVKFLFWIAI